MADTVAEAAHADQQRGQHERVDVADPQDLGEAGIEILLDERGGKGQHGAVDADQQDGEGKDAEGEPAAGHEVLTPCSSSSVMMCSKSLAATRPT